MQQSYATDAVTGVKKQQFWTDAVSEVLFPLALNCPNPLQFDGTLRSWDLSDASLSYVKSDAVTYRRERRHLSRDVAEEVLVSFSGLSDLVFTQNDRTLTVGRKKFVIQRGHAPYELRQSEANDILVLKVPASRLAHRLRSIDRYASQVYSADSGAGGLVMDMLRTLPRRAMEADEATRRGLTNCVLELLALAMECDNRVLGSDLSSVQAGHLSRAERYIRLNLPNRELSPELVASACGISVRYLHQVFSSSGKSVSQWIRELRLQACEQQLRNSRRMESIAEIAYQWGFGDQAQFSRHFRAHFGCTAQQMRAAAKAAGHS
jgi:AraC-like DNA-binding protein